MSKQDRSQVQISGVLRSLMYHLSDSIPEFDTVVKSRLLSRGSIEVKGKTYLTLTFIQNHNSPHPELDGKVLNFAKDFLKKEAKGLISGVVVNLKHAEV